MKHIATARKILADHGIDNEELADAIAQAMTDVEFGAMFGPAETAVIALSEEV